MLHHRADTPTRWSCQQVLGSLQCRVDFFFESVKKGVESGELVHGLLPVPATVKAS